MWQCRHCREKFIGEEPDHICVNDKLSRHFSGRRAILEPLFRALTQKLQKIGGITAESNDSFILLCSKSPFAVIRITSDHLDVGIKLPESAPIAPSLISAARLHIPGVTHYFTISSIKDITPDVMRSIMWSKDEADRKSRIKE